MTKWSFEVPIEHLSDFDEDQDYLFLLIHLLGEVKYLNYALNSKLGKILDNSANECGEPYPPHLLGFWATALQCPVVAPDHDDWTLDQVEKAFVDTDGKTLQRVYYVVRNEEEYKRAVTYECLISIPYEYRFDCSLKALYYCNHFLGLNNPLEVRVFQPDTVDTGMPIKLALQDLTIAKWMREGCPHIHTTPEHSGGDWFLRCHLPLKVIKLAKQNIKDLKKICNEEV